MRILAPALAAGLAGAATAVTVGYAAPASKPVEGARLQARVTQLERDTRRLEELGIRSDARLARLTLTLAEVRCAFVIYEDGSAEPEDGDSARADCHARVLTGRAVR